MSFMQRSPVNHRRSTSLISLSVRLVTPKDPPSRRSCRSCSSSTCSTGRQRGGRPPGKGGGGGSDTPMPRQKKKSGRASTPACAGRHGASKKGHKRVKKGSKKGQKGVIKGSKRGQKRVKKGSKRIIKGPSIARKGRTHVEAAPLDGHGRRRIGLDAKQEIQHGA